MNSVSYLNQNNQLQNVISTDRKKQNSIGQSSLKKTQPQKDKSGADRYIYSYS